MKIFIGNIGADSAFQEYLHPVDFSSWRLIETNQMPAKEGSVGLRRLHRSPVACWIFDGEYRKTPTSKTAHPRRVKRQPPQPGQESVWDYPRPPRLERSSKTIVVSFAGQEIARTSEAYRVLETSHPPSWYLPPASVHRDLLSETRKNSFCEWKGRATYWTVRVGNQIAENCAWSYPTPEAAFAAIRDYFAFYPNVFDCYVDGERVAPQPGGFYGGWITKDLAGPFKGVPQSSGW